MPNVFAPSKLAGGWSQHRRDELAAQPSDILRPHVRIVHQKRPTELTHKLRDAVQGLSSFQSRVSLDLKKRLGQQLPWTTAAKRACLQVVLHRNRVDTDIAGLVAALPSTLTRSALLEDIFQRTNEYMNTLGEHPLEPMRFKLRK